MFDEKCFSQISFSVKSFLFEDFIELPQVIPDLVYYTPILVPGEYLKRKVDEEDDAFLFAALL